MSLAVPSQAQNATDLEVVRQRLTVTDTVEVESPGVIDVIDRTRIQEIPGVNLDDRLRQIPGFSMFRRSSSLVAHPTTQGVNLRGLGSSGASRTVLLWDGIPVNSPFGGWIQWTRLDPELMDRIEVSRGATTSVWGDRAMGGTINMFSRQPQPMTLTAGMSYGNRNQAEFTGGLSNLWDNRIGASVYVRGFATDGYYLIPEPYRGSIDTQANTDFVAGTTRIDYLGDRDRVFFRVDMLGEQRDNGTTVQKNSTGAGQAAASWARETSDNSFWASVYHARENFHASFSSVADDRNSENLVNSQQTESEATGLAGLWRHRWDSWSGAFGADYTNYQGISIDHSPFNPNKRIGEGDRNPAGAFFQINGNFDNGFQLFLGSRFDSLSNGRAFYSPSGGVSYGQGIWRVRGSVYRSFRAPTLNELFRPFRVGNVFTLSNDQLKPERLFAFEGGVDITVERRRVSFTYYRNSLRDAITNVTLETTPSLITRQRQNLDNAVTHGIEFSYQERFNEMVQVQASYLFANSKFDSGLQVPQIPRNQFTAQLMLNFDRLMISPGVRAYSLQYDDDLNTLELPGFGVMTLSARYQIRTSLAATLEIDNVANKEFLVGFPGIPQVGNPTLVRAGIRWDGPI